MIRCPTKPRAHYQSLIDMRDTLYTMPSKDMSDDTRGCNERPWRQVCEVRAEMEGGSGTHGLLRFSALPGIMHVKRAGFFLRAIPSEAG